MSEFIWVRDPGTGHAGPMRKAEADALGSAVKAEPKHPTHDNHGDLLPWITQTSVADAAAGKSGKPAASDKEK